VTVAHYRPASSTDEARELAARSLPFQGQLRKAGQAKPHVTSSDEARAAIAAADNRPPNDRPHGDRRTRASASGPDRHVAGGFTRRTGTRETASLARAVPGFSPPYRQPGSELPRRKNEYVSQSSEAGGRVDGIALLTGGSVRR